MSPLLPSFKIAQNGRQVVKRKCLKMPFSPLSIGTNSYKFHRNASHYALYKIFTNLSTPLKKKAASSRIQVTNISFTTSQNLIKFHRNVRNSLYQTRTNRSAPQNEMAIRARNRNIFKRHFLLKHWSKFNINPQTQICSAEQNSNQS